MEMNRISSGTNRYSLYHIDDEVEFEDIVSKRYKEVFWEGCPECTPMYFNIKKKISSISKQICVPDGILLRLETSIDDSQIYIVEYELQDHSDEHILNQLRRFKNAIDNVESRKIIIDTLAGEIEKSPSLQKQWKNVFPKIGYYKGCSDLLLCDIAVVVVIDGISDSIEKLMNDVSSYKWIKEGNLYLLEVRLFSSITPSRKLPKKNDEVMALYPDGDNDWYRARVRSKQKGGKFLVDWYDGDKTNRTVTTICPVNDFLLYVKEHDY